MARGHAGIGGASRRMRAGARSVLRLHACCIACGETAIKATHVVKRVAQLQQSILLLTHDSLALLEACGEDAAHGNTSVLPFLHHGPTPDAAQWKYSRGLRSRSRPTARRAPSACRRLRKSEESADGGGCPGPRGGLRLLALIMSGSYHVWRLSRLASVAWPREGGPVGLPQR
jgi:hypothetical protein